MSGRNGMWPYHQDVHGNVVPCASNPCRLHGPGEDVMASSPDEAYRMIYSDKAPGMSSSPFSDVLGDGDRRVAVENMMVLYTDDIGGISRKSRKGLDGSDGILRRRDGSYLSVAEAKRTLGGDDAYNRYVIGETGGDNSQLADHWDDSRWLHDQADEALHREKEFRKWKTDLVIVG